MRATLGAVEVRWLGGAGLLWCGTEVLLIEAPPGIRDRLSGLGLLERVGGIALSGGRMRSVGGLIPVLEALDPLGSRPLPLWLPLGEERPDLLVGAWRAGWAPRRPVSLDAVRPGETFDALGFEVRTAPIERWEPGADGPRSASAIAMRLEHRRRSVAWVVGARPSRGLAALCDGASVAVVEVGVTPWPGEDPGWRCGTKDALELGSGAEELWLVGDDGRPLPSSDTPN